MVRCRNKASEPDKEDIPAASVAKHASVVANLEGASRSQPISEVLLLGVLFAGW
jgi:hypothetical protein